jgi:Family of unknown function (DUF6350)
MAATPDHPPDAPDIVTPTDADDSPATTDETPAAPDDDVSARPTVVLPVQRRARRTAGKTRRAPLSVAAGINALWAAAWTFVPILVTVTVVTLVGSPRPPMATTLRYGMAAWLLGHGVPLRLEGQPITLVPLAVTALAIWRCVRAGRNTSRALGVRRARSVRPAVVVAASVAIPYGLLGAAAAAIARDPGLEVPILRAGLTLGGFALVAAFFGAWPDSGFARRLRTGIPSVVRDGVRTAVVAVSLLLAAGAIAVGVQIAVAGGTATAILRNMHLGFAGDLGIVLVCLGYAPNLAVWASAYLAGPGFTLGQVPELPVFAGLPDRAVTGAGQILLVTPLIAGLVAGVLLMRRARTRSTPPGGRGVLAGAALLAAPIGAIVLAVVGFAAAGALGGSALANTGQVGWEFALIGGLGIGIGALAGSQLASRVSVRGG